MAKNPVNNLNVLSQDLLTTPQQVKRAAACNEPRQVMKRVSTMGLPGVHLD